MSKKESYWFSHDSNASTNPKLLALIRKYGYEGYGRWWRLLERLRDSEEYKFDISTPFAWEVLGQDLMMNPEEAEAFVKDCIDYYQLLETDGKTFWSDSLMDRMEYWEKRREVLRERGRKGGKASGKKRSNANNITATSSSSSTSEQELKQNEANETKQNDTILNETKQNDDDEADSNSGDEVFNNEVDSNGNNTHLEQLSKRALSDGQKFVLPYVSTGRVNKEQLGKWLSAFNRWLQFTGEEVKAERDYRRHFAAWFRYRDVTKETPEAYNPAGTINHSAPPTPPVAQELVPLPNKVVPLPVVRNDISATHKGRYSKGSNKYDMHWLKNLRDEVRSMGG